MITLAKYEGGSKLYGLSTPESDIDEREIFLNTEPAFILGTKRFDQLVKNNEKEDIHNIELRKFLELARKGNTQSIEVLYAKEESFTVLHPLMVELRANREKLVDSDTLFTVVSSFIHAQKFLMFVDGGRKAQPGSKRATALEKYGYIPKAASTAIRLAISASHFYKYGNYKVRLNKGTAAHSIKFHPEDWTPGEVKEKVEYFDNRLKDVYEKSKVKTKFDEDYANELLRKAYLPYLMFPNLI